MLKELSGEAEFERAQQLHARCRCVENHEPVGFPLTHSRSRGGALSRGTAKGRGEDKFMAIADRQDRAHLFVAVTAERYRNVRRCC